ncbi:MFS transporter [Priestia flexa]|uniref:MFS transporter n=1 Tax=Priestia flexa TaxID=86664 RepID=UPI0010FBEA92|nr:MFS transporter [Priestia flexa]QCS53545.1 MFS transporter [Priestia flexa]
MKKTELRGRLLLLASIGISGIGSWIYFIALNLVVLQITGSALAVSTLYIVRAAAAMLTNLWAGSLIDRLNKKHVMIGLNLIQAAVILWLAFSNSLLVIYVLVGITTAVGAAYEPTSMAYITKFLPEEKRKRFNSLRSLLDAGAFFTGPAVAGLLVMVGTPATAICINSIALVLSALLLWFVPNIEPKGFTTQKVQRLSFYMIKQDWHLVFSFSRHAVGVMLIYLLFSFMTVLMTATDSLEAAFSVKELGLTEGEYGLLVSIAGGGVLIGALLNTIIVEKIPTSWLLGMGSMLTAGGYMLFTNSTTFFIAACGCALISFAMAFANAAFYTFYQTYIPVEIMGRVGSLYGLAESLCIIIVTALFGILVEVISIRLVVIIGAALMIIVALAVWTCSLRVLVQRKNVSVEKVST